MPDFLPDLPPPLYGSPDPHIHHIGEPLPLGAPVRRSLDVGSPENQIDPRF